MFIPRAIRARWLDAGSSPIDWCEENYVVSPNIAEYTNTYSNVLLILLPLIAICSNVWQSYIKHVSRSPIIVFYIMIVLGLGSAYFHATLSLIGQYVDEMSIVWSTLVSYMTLMPQRYLPMQPSKRTTILCLSAYGLFLMYMWTFSPKLYAFWMFSLTIPTAYVLITEIRINTHPQLRNYCIFGLLSFLFGTILWLIDQFMCKSLLSVGIPGVHSIWHLIAAISTYYTLALFAFFKVYYDVPHVKPTFRNRFWVLPYVHCEKK